MKTWIPLIVALCAIAVPDSLSAEVRTRKIEYEHDGTKLVGYLTWDDAIEGERPGVLLVHEWWGLNDYARKRARMLAELGYAAFALDMYGEGKTTEHPGTAGEWAGKIRENVAAWQARALAGLDILRGQDVVDDERIAAIGYCFGGATVIQLAFAGAPILGVVSFHGSLPLPAEGQGESIEPKLLICHGADDGFIPAERVEAFEKALAEGDADWVFVSYGGARHSFTNPGADAVGIDGLRYDPAADRRSWAHMKAFLEELFAADESGAEE